MESAEFLGEVDESSSGPGRFLIVAPMAIRFSLTSTSNGARLRPSAPEV